MIKINALRKDVKITPEHLPTGTFAKVVSCPECPNHECPFKGKYVVKIGAPAMYFMFEANSTITMKYQNWVLKPPTPGEIVEIYQF